MTGPVDRLDDQAVLAVLTQVSAEVAEQRPIGDFKIASEAEARAALAALLSQQGTRSIAPDAVLANEHIDPSVARGVLGLLLEEPKTREAAEDAVSSPPADSQRSVELAVAGAVVLASLITWLQMSVEIGLDRKDGKTEFHFKLKKDATDKNTLAEIAKTISSLIL